MNTATPETDAATFKILSSLQSGTEKVVHAEICAKLERERDEALQKAEIWAAQVAESIRQVEASDALYRKQCKQLEAMREAIEDVNKILLAIQLNDIFEDTMRNHANAALAKLQPFIAP